METGILVLFVIGVWIAGFMAGFGLRGILNKNK